EHGCCVRIIEVHHHSLDACLDLCGERALRLFGMTLLRSSEFGEIKRLSDLNPKRRAKTLLALKIESNRNEPNWFVVCEFHRSHGDSCGARFHRFERR